MYSQITIIGNLGKDPEIKRLSNGATTSRFSVAVNKAYKKADGTEVKHTDWFLVEAYQAADKGLVTGLIQPHLRQGQLVMIAGEPTIERYTDSNQVEQRVFKIKLGPQSSLRMLGGRGDRETVDQTTGEVKPAGPAPNGAAAHAASHDDIPF